MNTLSDVVVQSPSRVQLFVTPRTVAHQASLSLTVSQSLPKFMSIASVMPSSHLILWDTILLLPSIFPSIRDWVTHYPNNLLAEKKKKKNNEQKTCLSSHFFCGWGIQAELSYLFCFKISFSRGCNKMSTWDPQSSQDLAGTEFTSMLTQTNIWQDLVPNQETLFIRVRI